MLSSVVYLHQQDGAAGYRIVSKTCYNAVYNIRVRAVQYEKNCNIILDAIPLSLNENLSYSQICRLAELQSNTIVLLWIVRNYGPPPYNE